MCGPEKKESPPYTPLCAVFKTKQTFSNCCICFSAETGWMLHQNLNTAPLNPHPLPLDLPGLHLPAPNTPDLICSPTAAPLPCDEAPVSGD